MQCFDSKNTWAYYYDYNNHYSPIYMDNKTYISRQEARKLILNTKNIYNSFSESLKNSDLGTQCNTYPQLDCM